MRIALGLSLLMLAGCTSLGPSGSSGSSGSSGEAPRVHVVKRGETLYTIAWRYGVDHRALAQWNDLSNPDLIFVGQRIRVTGPARGAASSTARAPQPAAPSQSGAPRPPASPGEAASSGGAAARTPDAPAPAWQWPADGGVVTTFGSSADVASGIGIAGRLGEPVRAAAAGRVVYAGSGLIGYGQLVIIKHNDTYLSAYGYNDRLLVSQGQDVRRGEPIAEMGLGPQRVPRLHFEIRRNGTPVNPLPLLGRGS